MGEWQGRRPAPPRCQCWVQAATRGRACKTFVQFETSARGLVSNVVCGRTQGFWKRSLGSTPDVIQPRRDTAGEGKGNKRKEAGEKERRELIEGGATGRPGSTTGPVVFPDAGRACETFVQFEASSRGLFFNIGIGGRGGAAPLTRFSQTSVLKISLAKYCPCSVDPGRPVEPPPVTPRLSLPAATPPATGVAHAGW